VFWPVVELLDALRPGGDPETLAQAVTVDVLILDDLGTEKPTEWTFERLYAVVNRRWLEELPTVGTSNLPASRKSAPDGYDGPTLDEVLGPRMFSRLVGGSVPIRMSGPDRRRTRP
jgi:DNA replication protein DnaC